MSILAKQQLKEFSKSISYHGEACRITATVRYDDQCGNGHNTFSITGSIDAMTGRDRDRIGGCIHEEIARYFPELAPLIRWHLFSSDGPMHYEANACYLAGDRDHNGLLAGESRQIRNSKTGALAWRRVIPDCSQYPDGPTCPPSPGAVTYEPWLKIGEGKPRQLDAARRIACWPDATDAQLSAPREELAAALAARLPALLAEFRAAVESFGFIF